MSFRRTSSQTASSHQLNWTVGLLALTAVATALPAVGCNDYAAAVDDEEAATAGQALLYPGDGSVAAGKDTDGTALFVCLGPYASGRHPGKLRADGTQCEIGYGTGTKLITNFYGLALDWKAGSGGTVPLDPYDFGGGQFPCKAKVDDAGQYHLGKFVAGGASCQVSYGGGVQYLTSYQILVTKVNGADSFPMALVEMTGSTPPRFALLGNGTVRSLPPEPLYLCAGNIDGVWHPGKTQMTWNFCNVAHDNVEKQAYTYKVLVPNFQSPNSARDFWPFGYEADGSKLGVCRVNYEGGTQLGKYLPSKNQCNFPYDGEEVVRTSGFTVLRK